MATAPGAWPSLRPTVTLPRRSRAATALRTAGSSRSMPAGRRQRISSERPFTLLTSQLQTLAPAAPLARAKPVMLERPAPPPIRALPPLLPVRRPLRPPACDVAVVLVEGLGEGVPAAAVGDEVEGGAFRRLHDGGKRRATGIGDGPRRQAAHAVGVVGAVDAEIGPGQRPAERTLTPVSA